jgi:hypothetical protein
VREVPQTAVAKRSKLLATAINERRNKVNEAKKAFWEYFLPNEIYFPEQTADDVRELERMLSTIANKFYFAHEPKPDCQLSQEDRYKGWENGGEPLLAQEGPLFTRIHAQFQDLIGARPKTGGAVIP